MHEQRRLPGGRLRNLDFAPAERAAYHFDLRESPSHWGTTLLSAACERHCAHQADAFARLL